jgi:[protein-PII] uridylyltransferase
VSFRAILSEAGAVHPVLSLMHELGVLGRFIPEFDKLTCLVQHEYYHRYTADVHTLNAIRELDRIFTEAEPITLKYRAALHETTDARPALPHPAAARHRQGRGHPGPRRERRPPRRPHARPFRPSPAGRELVSL